MENHDGKNAGPVIEALLFTMGRSVSIKDLAQVIGISEKEALAEARKLSNYYKEAGSGIRIVELENAFQMCAAQEMYDYINTLMQQPVKPVLTGVMLETLAIIAYRQPVTRAEIEQIRGVNCSHAVNRLLEYGLITEAGRLQAPGRPILLATTEEFLRAFGVSSAADLPDVMPEEMELLRSEAEQELPEKPEKVEV